ncbi:hypothetical protein Nepgr_007026 [Nepenthes gracilis]|uniref:Senescence regulator n=1 Tax=Nepenthes gracilis TaxID=150966 RepID=A0AAD3S6D1_NEPGR|nr:hypothetical protein Nepgr_007026 [Nepenthes gracilis]
MEEEFQESEIVFSDLVSDRSVENEDVGGNYYQDCRETKQRRRRKKKKKQSSSVPVNIPENVFRDNSEYDELDELEDDDGTIIPPHVIVARRIAGKIACSVHSANGRILKGRNLCEARNSILRMTGFLET